VCVFGCVRLVFSGVMDVKRGVVTGPNGKLFIGMSKGQKYLKGNRPQTIKIKNDLGSSICMYALDFKPLIGLGNKWASEVTFVVYVCLYMCNVCVVCVFVCVCVVSVCTYSMWGCVVCV
jgi:hypothetical protein